MHVSGEDYIARLSTSFNQMAASLQSHTEYSYTFSTSPATRCSSPTRHTKRAHAVLRWWYMAMRGSVLLARSLLDLLQHRRRTRRAAQGRAHRSRFPPLDSSTSAASMRCCELALATIPTCPRRSPRKPTPQRVRKGIEVKVIGDDEPSVVEADTAHRPSNCAQLITNAGKYSGSRSAQHRTSRCMTAFRSLSRDFGVGLSGDAAPAGVRPLLARLPGATQGSCTGLGLAYLP